MKHDLKWFKENIGKVLFRMPKLKEDPISVIEIGVLDLEHARYLKLSQDELDLVYWTENDKILRTDKMGHIMLKCPLCGEVHVINKERWKTTWFRGLPTIKPSINTYSKYGQNCHFTVSDGNFRQGKKKYWLYGW